MATQIEAEIYRGQATASSAQSAPGPSAVPAKPTPVSSYTRDRAQDLETFREKYDDCLDLALRGDKTKNSTKDFLEEIGYLEKYIGRIGLTTSQQQMLIQPLYVQFFYQSLARYKTQVLRANADPETAIVINEHATQFSILGKNKYQLLLIGLAGGLSHKKIIQEVEKLREETKDDYKILVLKDAMQGIEDYFSIPKNVLDKKVRYFFTPKEVLGDVLSPFQAGITHFSYGFL
ncbi:MAG: hypothetical protein R3257_06915 [bacterium]|nr:hypothetical protein [bacterium]